MKRNYKGSNNPHYKGIFSKKCFICPNLIKGPKFWVRDRKFCSYNCWYNYNTGENHHWTNNVKHKEQVRQIGYKNKDKHYSNEINKKKGLLGKLNPMYGKTHTYKVRKLLSKKRLEQIIPLYDTKPEKLVQNILIKNNIKFEKHVSIFGQPDIFIKPNLCIFIDGNYWHNYPFGNNRDKQVNKILIDKGYKIIRIWESEIYQNPEIILEKIKIIKVI